jgi:hypothetical protein
VTLAATAATAAALPACTSVASPAPERAPSFAEAVQALEAPPLYHYGKEAANAIVLYRGFINCPQQSDELARRFYERGCNVFVPRIPLHRYRNRLTQALGRLTVQLQDATAASYQLTCAGSERTSPPSSSRSAAHQRSIWRKRKRSTTPSRQPFLMPIGFPDRVGLAVITAIAWLPDR